MDSQSRRDAIAAEYGIDPERVTICPPARTLTHWQVLEHPAMQAIALAPAVEETKRRRALRAAEKRRAAHKAERVAKVMAVRGRYERIVLAHKLGLSVHEISNIVDDDETNVYETIQAARDVGDLKPADRKKHGRKVDLDALAEMAAAGASVRQCAERLGVAENTVCAAARRHGIALARKVNGRPWTDEDDAELARLVRFGMRRELIATQIGRTEAAVNSRILWLRRQGVLK